MVLFDLGHASAGLALYIGLGKESAEYVGTRAGLYGAAGATGAEVVLTWVWDVVVLFSFGAVKEVFVTFLLDTVATEVLFVVWFFC